MLSIVFSLLLTVIPSPRRLDALDMQSKNGRTCSQQNTFITMMKLVHLLHSNVLNFAWMSKLPYTYRSTHLVSNQVNTSLLCTY